VTRALYGRAVNSAGEYVDFAALFADGPVHVGQGEMLKLVPGADITDLLTNSNYAFVSDACSGYSHPCKPGDPSPDAASKVADIIASLAPGAPAGP
jgi:hypothetical protein